MFLRQCLLLHLFDWLIVSWVSKTHFYPLTFSTDCDVVKAFYNELDSKVYCLGYYWDELQINCSINLQMLVGIIVLVLLNCFVSVNEMVPEINIFLFIIAVRYKVVISRMEAKTAYPYVCHLWNVGNGICIQRKIGGVAVTTNNLCSKWIFSSILKGFH